MWTQVLASEIFCIGGSVLGVKDQCWLVSLLQLYLQSLEWCSGWYWIPRFALPSFETPCWSFVCIQLLVLLLQSLLSDLCWWSWYPTVHQEPHFVAKSRGFWNWCEHVKKVVMTQHLQPHFHHFFAHFQEPASLHPFLDCIDGSVGSQEYDLDRIHQIHYKMR